MVPPFDGPGKKDLMIGLVMVGLWFVFGAVILQDMTFDLQKLTAEKCDEKFGNWSWVQGSNNLTCVDPDTGETYEIDHLRNGQTSDPLYQDPFLPFKILTEAVVSFGTTGNWFERLLKNLFMIGLVFWMALRVGPR